MANYSSMENFIIFLTKKCATASIYIFAILIFCTLEHYRNCNNGTCKLKLQKVKNADYIICVISSTFVQLSFSRLSYKYILPCKNQVQNRVYRYVSIPIQHATFLIHNIFFSKCTHLVRQENTYGYGVASFGYFYVSI